ncbi:MAG TPA: reverse transcriptase/maturase family protein [Anaerolineae bacterium]|nr:reverse transcriptase/maturase family protein [Anaerolineae bacterium]
MYEDIADWFNIYEAYIRASRGKRSKPNVAAFEHRLEDELWDLYRILQTRSYRPGGYVSFVIHEPKRRVISAAPFRDRVVHHALCQITEPVFERSFITDSYANRVGKGTHRALNRCQQFARRYKYVLQADIRQFFPSIDHQILKSILGSKLKDDEVIDLVEQIIDSGAGVLQEVYEMVYFAGDDLLAATRPRGLPIGNLTSQFWANCYLNGFDHFVKRKLRCKGYVRFVDDFLLFADDKESLWRWKMELTMWLARLRLVIHDGAQVQPVSEGVPFLGFIVFPEKRRLKRRKGIHYQRHLKGLLQLYVDGEIAFEEMTRSVKGWVNHVRYSNSVGLRKRLFRELLIERRKG